MNRITVFTWAVLVWAASGGTYRSGANPDLTVPEFVCPPDLEFPLTNVNGTCHNLEMPLFGASNSIQTRLGPPLYADVNDVFTETAVGTVVTDRPSPRLLSNLFSEEINGSVNLKNASTMLIFFGQFIDHDLTLVYEQEGDGSERIQIPVPADDAVFSDGDLFIQRSDFEPNPVTVRDFVNINTGWLDLSQVYGDTAKRSAMLRTFKDGLMNTTIGADGSELLPLVDNTFICGDKRCEENVILTSLQTLFLREHNRLARVYLAAQPGSSDEDVFQSARARNIVQYQSIVWDFYLPYLFGRRTFERMTGPFKFDPYIDPTTTLLFSTAAYRYGHSGIPNTLIYMADPLDEDDEVETYPPSYGPTYAPKTYPPTEGVKTYPPTEGIKTYPPTEGIKTYPPTEGVKTYPPTEGAEEAEEVKTYPPSYGPTYIPTYVPTYVPTYAPKTYPPTEGVKTYPPTEGVKTYPPTEGAEEAEEVKTYPPVVWTDIHTDICADICADICTENVPSN